MPTTVRRGCDKLADARNHAVVARWVVTVVDPSGRIGVRCPGMSVVEGRIVQFGREGGFGFIRADDYDEDVFFHVNDVVQGAHAVRVGSAVELRVSEGDRGLRADDVVLLDLPAGQHGGDVVAEVTEALLGADPTLTAAQILNARDAIVKLLDRDPRDD